MAMNKKEKAELEKYKQLSALRMTEQVLPDVKKPTDYGDLATGYTFNGYSFKVSESCSSTVSHSTSGSLTTTSQSAIEMYSSKLLALKAMRNALELRYAKELRSVDIMIENERTT